MIPPAGGSGYGSGVIYHLATPTDWEDAQDAGDYRISTRGRTLEQEGFIHASRLDQLPGVVDAHYRDAGPLLLLTLDPLRLTADVRDDEVAPGQVFPHVYGPLDLAAVVDVSPWPATPSEEVTELAAQEQRIVFDRLDHDVAWELGTQLVSAAGAAELPVSVAVRFGAQRMFHAARPGTSAEQDWWLDRKARTVALFRKSSLHVGALYRAIGTALDADSGLDADRHAAHGGAFPLRLRDGAVVGSVAVSGLPQREDHALVVREMDRFLGSA